jgi:transcriptional regulator with XRE-family HTH domain
MGGTFVSVANISASDLAGRRIREARQRRGWTARDLAERCAEAGAPQVSATVITNLETRRRATREITVEEVFTLARVLDVPPLQLIIPLDASETLEVLPGLHMNAPEAVHWIGGDTSAYLLGQIGLPQSDLTADLLRRADAESIISAVRLIREVATWIVYSDEILQKTPGPPQDRRDIDASMRVYADRLMLLSARIEALGYSPPQIDGMAEILTRYGIPGTLADWRKSAGQPVGPTGLPVFRLPAVGEESNARLMEQHVDLLEQVHTREAEVAQHVTNVDAVMTGVRGLETIAASVADQEYAASIMAQAAEHRKLGERLKSELAYQASAAEKHREMMAQSLRYIRAEMRRRGMLLPPLPPLMKDIDGES